MEASTASREIYIYYCCRIDLSLPDPPLLCCCCLDPIVVELLVTTLFTIPWSAFMCVPRPKGRTSDLTLTNHASFSLFSIFKRFEHPYFAIFAAEIAGLTFLWIFWLAGAAGSSVRLCTLLPTTRGEERKKKLMMLFFFTEPMGNTILVSTIPGVPSVIGPHCVLLARLAHGDSHPGTRGVV